MPFLRGDDPGDLARAAERVAAGGLLAFPTETVYGLGARADDDTAVAAIYALKGRPPGHPLIVHLADAGADAVAAFAQPPSAAAQRLIAHFWPGPLTLILPRLPGHANAAAGDQPTVGLRVPSHPVARRFLQACAALGVPGVAGPSANRFGGVSPTTAAHVQQEFGQALWVLDGGPCQVGIESAIVDCSGPAATLLRPGGLDRRQIEDVLGHPLGDPNAQSARAPGTLAAHYAPAAPLRVLDTDALRRSMQAPLPPGLALYSRAALSGSARGAGILYSEMPETPSAVAHELFAVLRAFDAAGAKLIWVEQPPAGVAWDGVRDRLQRAAAA